MKQILLEALKKNNKPGQDITYDIYTLKVGRKGRYLLMRKNRALVMVNTQTMRAFLNHKFYGHFDIHTLQDLGFKTSVVKESLSQKFKQ